MHALHFICYYLVLYPDDFHFQGKMHQCISSYAASMSRGNFKRMSIIYIGIAITVLKLSHWMTPRTDTVNMDYRISKREQQDLMQKIETLSSAHKTLSKTVTKLGFIDSRTDSLLKELNQSLSQQYYWLGRSCAFSRPISSGIFGVGQTAKIGEYLREIGAKRLMFTVSHMDYDSDVTARSGVTLLTQLSSNRLELLDLIAGQWQGAIDAAVYTAKQDVVEVYKKV